MSSTVYRAYCDEMAWFSRRPAHRIVKRPRISQGSGPSSLVTELGTSARLQDFYELLGGTLHKELSGSRQCRRPNGFAAECDGLEDPPCARTIGNASSLVPGLRGRAGDKLQGQVSIVAVWRGSQSKRHLDIFKQLLPLRLRKTNYQPGEGRQESVLVAGLQAHSRQKTIRADHLQAIATGLIVAEHQGRCF
jgi:hypothetical protein